MANALKTTSENVCKAKLDDGDIVTYDACRTLDSDSDLEGFTCIGTGVIHSVNDVQQNVDKKFRFYRAEQST